MRPLNGQNLCKKKEKKDVTKYRTYAAARNGTRVAVQKVGLPGLVGMIATGMILGPYGLGWLDSSILDISSQLRRIALIIILMRAGLSLNLEDLKRQGAQPF